MNGSWLKLYRKIESWDWFTDSYTLHVFLFLLIRAETEDETWRGVELKRGQVVTTRRMISAATGIPESAVYRSLRKLESTGAIEQLTNNKRTIVTICKFDTYNPSREDMGTTNVTASDTTIQEIENNKEKNISKDISQKKSDILSPDDLAAIWNEGRGECPKVMKLSGKRKAKAKLRIAEFGGTREEQERTARTVMERIRESDFLQYKWPCNFGWLVDNSENWVKVMEGNYRNKGGNAKRGRMDDLKDDLDFIHDFFNNGDTANTTPDEQ